MKRTTVLESDLRNILRDESRFPMGTVSFCEFGKGGDPGFPDTMIAVTPNWQPLELKRGRAIIKHLRPTQRRWHKTSLLLCIPTFGAAYDGAKVRLFKLSIGKKRQLCESVIGCWPETQFNYRELRAAIVMNKILTREDFDNGEAQCRS